MLNESRVEWPDHTGHCKKLYNCNHYRGCSHDCVYCYARKMSQRYRPSKWCEASPVRDAVLSVEKDLRTKEPGRVMFSSMTDPYQPIEASLGLSREILTRLFDSKFYTLIITKSDLVRRDFDLFAGRRNVELGMTITGLGDEATRYEPVAPPNSRRIEALREAHARGIKTFVSLEPWIPDVTKPLEIIPALAPFVDRWIVGTMNYCGASREVYAREAPLVKKLLEEIRPPGGVYIKKELKAYLPSSL